MPALFLRSDGRSSETLRKKTTGGNHERKFIYGHTHHEGQWPGTVGVAKGTIRERQQHFEREGFVAKEFGRSAE